MALGVFLSVPAEHTINLGKSPHLRVENRVKLQPRGIVTEGLWARGKSSQCQDLGQNFSHEYLIKKPSAASNSRSSPIHTHHWDAPWPGWPQLRMQQAKSQVPPSQMRFPCRKPTAGKHTAPPKGPLAREPSTAAQHISALAQALLHKLQPGQAIHLCNLGDTWEFAESCQRNPFMQCLHFGPSKETTSR